MEEEWRDIKGWEGYYQASNLGRIRSVDRFVKDKKDSQKKIKGKIINPSMGTHGYLSISLYNNGISKTYTVHKIIAITFIEPISGKNFINHIDGNKINNNISNLEHVTKSENHLHAYKIGLQKPQRGMLGKYGKDNYGSKPISQFAINGEFIKTYEGVRDAIRKNISLGNHISEAANGKYKTAYGYVWKYVNDDKIKQAI